MNNAKRQKNLIALFVFVVSLLLALTMFFVFQPAETAYAISDTEMAVSGSPPLSEEFVSAPQTSATASNSSQYSGFEYLIHGIGYCGYNRNYTVKQYAPYQGNYLKDATINYPGFVVAIKSNNSDVSNIVELRDYYYNGTTVSNNINTVSVGNYSLQIYRNPFLDSRFQISNDNYSGNLHNGIPNSSAIGNGTMFLRFTEVFNGQETAGEWISLRNMLNQCNSETPYEYSFMMNNEGYLEICFAYQLKEQFIFYDLHNLIQTHKIKFVKESYDLKCTDTERKTGLIIRRPLVLSDKDNPEGITTAGFQIENPGHGFDPVTVTRNGVVVSYTKDAAYTQKGYYEISTQGNTQKVYIVDEDFVADNIEITPTNIINNGIRYYNLLSLNANSQKVTITYLKSGNAYFPDLQITVNGTSSNFGAEYAQVGDFNVVITGTGALQNNSILRYTTTIRIKNYDAKSNRNALFNRRHPTNMPSKFFGVQIVENQKTKVFACKTAEKAAELATLHNTTSQIMYADYESDIVYEYVGFEDEDSPEYACLNGYKFAFNDGVESVSVQYKRFNVLENLQFFTYGVLVDQQLTESTLYQIIETNAMNVTYTYYAYFINENISSVDVDWKNNNSVSFSTTVTRTTSLPEPWNVQEFRLKNFSYNVGEYCLDPWAQIIVEKDGVKDYYVASDINTTNTDDIVTYTDFGTYTVKFIDRCHKTFQFTVVIDHPEYILNFTGNSQYEIQSDLIVRIDKNVTNLTVIVDMVQVTDLQSTTDSIYITFTIAQISAQRFVVITYTSPVTGAVTINAIILAGAV